MILRVPMAPGVPLYVQRTKLEGVDYQLRFDWNARSGTWYLQLLDSDGVALTGMQRLVIGVPLLRLHHADPRVPPGELVLAEPGRLPGEGMTLPTFDDVNTRVVLLYAEAADVEALKAGG